MPAIAHVNPTPEWLARYHNIMDSPTTSSGFKMAARPIYRKHPWFESLCGRDDAFNDEDLAALRYYRNIFEAAQHGQIKSSLSSMIYGSSEGEGDGHPTEALLWARQTLAKIELALGSLLITMRAIALEDMTYEQVAMARFGYRQADYFDAASGVFTQRPRPTSGRNPGKIKAEFIAGTKLLAGAMLGRRIAVSTGPTVVDQPTQGMRVSDQLLAKLSERRSAGRPVGSIIMAKSVADTIMREMSVIGGVELLTFSGVPVDTRDDWPWGWVLNGEAGE